MFEHWADIHVALKARVTCQPLQTTGIWCQAKGIRVLIVSFMCLLQRSASLVCVTWRSSSPSSFVPVWVPRPSSHCIQSCSKLVGSTIIISLTDPALPKVSYFKDTLICPSTFNRLTSILQLRKQSILQSEKYYIHMVSFILTFHHSVIENY